jgi:hypothetical protein
VDQVVLGGGEGDVPAEVTSVKNVWHRITDIYHDV